MTTLTALGTPYTQDFNTLAVTGTSSVLPTGWVFLETGNNANTLYTAGTGSSTAGDTYSFGAASSSDRALGNVQSGSLLPTFGAMFTNNTGATITSLQIAYTGEQWRLGTAGRTDRLDFQYSLDATALNSGSWTDVDTLDFLTPTTTTTGAKDGNGAGNRTLLTFTVSNLSIASGSTFWLRWNSFDATGADDGLAVDDFSLTPLGTTASLPSVTLAALDANAAEPGDPGSFRFTRTGPTTSELTVAYTIGGNASGTDYTPALSGSLTFAAGSAQADVIITPVDDGDAEPPETLVLTLSASAAYTIGAGSSATVTIADNDSAPTLISAIQGTGAVSPLLSTTVTIEAIVTGDFQGSSGLSGFFVQEEDAQADTNPLTSEGLFVFQGAGGAAVNLGDKVRVTGNVSEFTSGLSSLTQLTSVTSLVIVSSSNPLPAATPLAFPLANPLALEPLEGMRVAITTALTVTDSFTLGRFGEVLLSSDGAGNQPGSDARLDTYTQFNDPSVAGYSSFQDQLALRRIVLDDASSVQNADPIAYGRAGNPLSASNTLRGGDTVANLVGVIDDRFGAADTGNYRLQPTATVNFDAVNTRSVTAPDVGGSVRVASFNVLNYFNGNGTGGGFPTSRGADSTTEFARQQSKIVSAIVGLNADILGLLEIENDGYGATSAIAALVNALNAATAPGSYAFVNPGAADMGSDEIAVGFIYKPATVTPQGAAATLTSAFVDPDGGGGFNSGVQRPSLAQTFKVNASGETFTPVINHLKSKGTSAGGAGDADGLDGQGLSNGTRLRAADTLVDWLKTDPTGSGDPDFLLIGDFNAYAREDPVREILAGADDVAGTADDFSTLTAATSYSYSFAGQWGALDHAFASSSLGGQVTGAAKWHINADEPPVLDYNLEFKSVGQQTSLFAPTAFRSSDHDPIVVGLDLGRTINGTSGRDVLAGSAGNDTIAGAAGRDVIATGAGGDRIVFNGLIDFFDLVADFTRGQDKIDIRALLQSVGYSGSNPVADGYLQWLTPTVPAFFGSPAMPIGTLVMFDADGAASAELPRLMVQVVGVALDGSDFLVGGG